MTAQSNNILDIAAAKCANSGVKLTDKRARILEVVVEAGTPLSAYEILDQYNLDSDKNMQPMSAYRILEFLESEQLVHKLSSENKYVACSHIACDHAHQVPQFLICSACKKVKEIAISRDVIDRLNTEVAEAGYSMTKSQIELDCLCDSCQ